VGHPDEQRSMKRRDMLVFGGAALAAMGVSSGCAFLRGGAKHPRVQVSAAAITGNILRIPVSELTMPVGEVLEVKPGKPYSDFLITRMSDQSFRVITADCSHMGCTVDFTPAKGEWECPCHGSRFDLEGRVLEGPAEDPLSPLASFQRDDALWVDLSATVKLSR
jgi:Rieske Fe-S protein